MWVVRVHAKPHFTLHLCICHMILSKTTHTTFKKLELANSATQFCSDRQTLAGEAWLIRSLSERSHYFTASVGRDIFTMPCQTAEKSEQHLYKAAVIVCHTVDNYHRCVHFFSVSLTHSAFGTVLHCSFEWLWDVALGQSSDTPANQTPNPYQQTADSLFKHTLCFSVFHVMQATRKKTYLSSLLCSRRNQLIFLSFLSKQISPFLWS